MTYHSPVLLKRSVDALVHDFNGVYVDCTFGGGGHSRDILSRLEDGKLFAFDQDEDAERNLIHDEKFVLLRQNFRFMQNMLRAKGVDKIDGILADLGISSFQIDEPTRGFSTRFNHELDMRMNQSQVLSAKKVANEYSKEDLVQVFRQYGDFKNASRLADVVILNRNQKSIETTEDLKSLFDFIPANKSNQFFARLFQAIRIEVNDEMGALRDLLQQSADLLKVGGRLVVISYHSLEDRLVKRFMKYGNFEGQPEKDEIYGRWESPFRQLGKVIIPDENEIKLNPRARSAKLRIAERI